jgi:hypothetical protein
MANAWGTSWGNSWIGWAAQQAALTIDAAVVQALSNDAVLSTLAPGGVWQQASPQGTAEPFIVIRPIVRRDQYVVDSVEGFESYTFAVDAVESSTTGAAAESVADRVHALLHNGRLSGIGGYDFVDMMRRERIAYVEIDEDRDRRYQHRGGLYEVLVEPTV